jgi:hypothetical protein
MMLADERERSAVTVDLCALSFVDAAGRASATARRNAFSPNGTNLGSSPAQPFGAYSTSRPSGPLDHIEPPADRS